MKKSKHKYPHGLIQKVSEKVGLSRPTISKVLHGVYESPRKAEILKATAEYLKERKAKEAEAMAELNEALNQ